jgi:toxin ParE1/3/4
VHSFKNSIFADEDIISILAYTYEQWGIEQKEKYETLLESGRERIRNDPFLTGSQNRSDLADDCRSYRVEHHYFMYRLRDGVVEIARVLHENMDFHLQLREGYFPA